MLKNLKPEDNLSPALDHTSLPSLRVAGAQQGAGAGEDTGAQVTAGVPGAWGGECPERALGNLGRDPTPPGISRGPVSPDFSSPDLLSHLKCVAIQHLYRYVNFLKTSPCAPGRGGDDTRDGPGTCVPAGPVPAPCRPSTTLSTCSWGLVPPPPRPVLAVRPLTVC